MFNSFGQCGWSAGVSLYANQGRSELIIERATRNRILTPLAIDKYLERGAINRTYLQVVVHGILRRQTTIRQNRVCRTRLFFLPNGGHKMQCNEPAGDTWCKVRVLLTGHKKAFTARHLRS
jgi:hypothetical protein